jgi:outer membrane protein assembly factor BamE (lipoprotein component of BamABCDE complex)
LTQAKIGASPEKHKSSRPNKKPAEFPPRVIAFYLDDKNRVTRVADYGLKDGVVFDFISRTTPTGGQESSFLGGIFRRLGASAV